MRIILSLILVISLFKLSAQHLFQLKGCVRDSMTNEILDLVHVSIINSHFGSVSNMDGSFKLKYQSLPIKLEISRLNYESKIIEVLSNDYLNITLVSKAYLLREFLVSDVQTVLNDEQINIKDYEFYDSNIIVLGYYSRYNRSALFLIDQYGDTIASLNIKGRPIKLSKDCYERIILEYKNEAYHVWYTSTHLYVSHLYYKNENNIELPCHAIYNGKLITSVYVSNQLLGYATLSNQDSSFQYFKFIDNQDILYRPENWGLKPSDVYNEDNSFVLELNNQKLITSFYHPTIEKPLKSNSHLIAAAKFNNNKFKDLNYMLTLHYFKNVIDKPIYAPMHLLNNKLYLINHTQ